MNKTLSFSIKNNIHGFLLIEALVAVGIMGIILFGVVSMIELINFNGSRISMTMSRNELINRVRMNATKMDTIKASALLTNSLGSNGLTPDIGTPNNLTKASNFANCVPDITGNNTSCTKVTMEDTRGDRIYLVEGNSPDVSKIIAGEDVYYTFKGARCSQSEAINPNFCPLNAQAWFEPFCLNGTTCSKAMSVTVRYRISLRSDYTGKTVLPAVESEVYVPLSRGIQLTGLYDQDTIRIDPNTDGIFSLQKYYSGASGPNGLQFGATIGSPSGLSHMKLQMRSITGSASYGLFDNAVPASLLSQGWVDVPNPSDNTSEWRINLVNATSNETKVFGRETTTASSWKIGSTTNPNDSKFYWTIDGGGNLIPPTMLSGFYQFRVLATDVLGGTLESTNYITLRLVSNPEIIPKNTNPSDTQIRKCAGSTTITYSYFLADDEGLGTQTATLDSTNVSFSQISGSSGSIDIPFNLNLDIGNVAQRDIPIQITAINSFNGRTVNGQLITAKSYSTTINLSQAPVIQPTLNANPVKVRLGSTTSVSSTYVTGTCCSETPSVSWNYLTVPEIGLPMLGDDTSQASGAVSCATDASNNTKTCSVTESVSGVNYSTSTANNIRVSFDYASNQLACIQGTNANALNYNQANIPVIQIPGIGFYITESIWLNVPNGLSGSIKSFTPTAYVRIDYDPEEEVRVKVVKASDNTEVCSITFPAGTDPVTPRDRPCPLPNNYSGDLIIVRDATMSPQKVMIDSDSNSATFKAKITSASSTHKMCSANLTNHANYQNYTVPTTLTDVMKYAPWGYTSSGGTEVEYNENDSKNWDANDIKHFQCYDSWSGIPNDNYNQQDIYNLALYNSTIPSGSVPRHRDLRDGSGLAYASYYFPFYNSQYQFNDVNVPWIFMVYRNNTPNPVSWRYNKPLGGNVTSDPQTWLNVTSDLCGSVSLSQYRVYASKAMGYKTDIGSMTATNVIYVRGGTNNGYYSYAFMCSYGRWNPVGRSTNLLNE